MNNMNAGEPSQTWLGEASECTLCEARDGEAMSFGGQGGGLRWATWKSLISSGAKNMNADEQKVPSPLVGKVRMGTSPRLKNAKPRHPELVSGSYQRCKLAKAFSLIELMISLIVVSCITAAFTPVITKKLKSGSLIAGSVGDAFRNSKMGLEDCKEYAGIDNCMFCDIKKKECKICAGSACDVTHQYTVSKNCTCGECSNLFTDCARCTEQKCEACIAGKYFDNNSCKPVSDYPGCEGSKCYTDPNATPPITDPKPCPDGSICPNGKKIDCTTAELTHKLCKDGEAGTCPDGYICENGKPTKCTGQNSLKYCHDGIVENCPEGYTCSNGLRTSCASQPANIRCIDGEKKSCPEGYTCSGGVGSLCTSQPPSKRCINGVVGDCPEGSTCSKGVATACTGVANNIRCIDGEKKNCPEGYTCSNGVGSICSSQPASKRCVNGIITDCPEGYTCSKGVATACTGVASTTRCINGIKTNCDAGYFCSNGVQPSSKCKANCETCSNASTCTKCASVSGTQYFLYSNSCYSCPTTGVSSCTGTGLTCSTPTYKKSSDNLSCVLACPTGCNCNAGSSTCVSCKAGYCMKSGSCVSTSKSNCAECSSSASTCTKCNSGYILSGGSCGTCPSGATCTGTSDFTCPSGKYKTDTGCIDKPTSCGQANSAWSNWSLVEWSGHAACGWGFYDWAGTGAASWSLSAACTCIMEGRCGSSSMKGGAACWQGNNSETCYTINCSSWARNHTYDAQILW